MPGKEEHDRMLENIRREVAAREALGDYKEVNPDARRTLIAEDLVAEARLEKQRCRPAQKDLEDFYEEAKKAWKTPFPLDFMEISFLLGLWEGVLREKQESEDVDKSGLETKKQSTKILDFPKFVN